MKTIFTICALFVTIFSFGQTTFRTAIDGFGEFELYGLVQLDNGTFIGTGTSYSDTDSRTYISLVQLSAQGHLLQSKVLQSGDEDVELEGFEIIKTTDGGMAVSGEINQRIALLKFDAALNLQWHKQYQSIEDFNYGSRVVQTSDGGYMIAAWGETDLGDNNFQHNPSVVKTDSQGGVVWSREYLELGDGYNFNIVATKDGNYAFLASIETADSAYTKLVKINSNGNVIWAKYIASENYQEAFGLLSASDGSLVVAGSIYKTSSDQYVQLMVLKFDQSGNLLWSRESDNGTGSDIYPWDIVEDKDGGYIVTADEGFYNETENHSSDNAYALKVSSSGSLVWTKNFSFPDSREYFYSIIRTSDGGYAASGNVYHYSNINTDSDYDRGIIYKFDENFNTCGSAGSFGNLTDMKATAIAQQVSLYSYNANINDDDIQISSIGTELNLCNVLPLQLLSFNATLQNKRVNIEWKTANEVNTDYFTVERSSNGTAFTALQNVTAKGNSSNVQTYTTTDLQPMFGTSYYRLKEVDKDGKINYSNIVPVTVSANGTIVISPNPVRDNIRVLLQSKENSSLTFQVADMSGRVLATQSAKVNAGANTIIIPASSLSKGLYVLKVIQNNTTQSIKFVKE